MLLVFPEGAWAELLCDRDLQCQDAAARSIEWQLRSRIYYQEHFPDDTVIKGSFNVNKAIDFGNWGLQGRRTASAESLGAWTFDPVIEGPADLAKLRYPVVTHDQAASQQRLQLHQELLGDILNVQLKGITHISFHLMAEYTGLRGLEQVMMDMIKNPGMLHEAMAFFQEGNRRRVQQFVEQNLLDLNNDNSYHSSGGNGYTDELPAAGYTPGHVRTCDMWSSAESQELAERQPRDARGVCHALRASAAGDVRPERLRLLRGSDQQARWGIADSRDSADQRQPLGGCRPVCPAAW